MDLNFEEMKKNIELVAIEFDKMKTTLQELDMGDEAITGTVAAQVVQMHIDTVGPENTIDFLQNIIFSVQQSMSGPCTCGGCDCGDENENYSTAVCIELHEDDESIGGVMIDVEGDHNEHLINLVRKYASDNGLSAQEVD